MSSRDRVKQFRPLSRQVPKASTALTERLHAAIRARGPMTFAAFMQAALYDPQHGYYTRDSAPQRRRRDYLTAPHVHSVLGQATAALTAEIDAALGAPDPFTLVDVGSGDGELLAAICDQLQRNHPRLYGRLRLWSVEHGGEARRQQQQNVPPPPRGIRWAADLGALPATAFDGAVISNELLDAFPVHRVTCMDGELREVLVDLDGDSLNDRLGPLSDPRLLAYLQANRIRVREGQTAEICLGVDPWLRAISRRLRRGFVLTVDYGLETASLYDANQRQQGTLVCHHRYQLNAEPYCRVGDQDISAHVDFGNLRRCGRQLGFDDLGLVSLRVFLLGFAVMDRMPEPGTGSDPTADYLGLRHLLVSEIVDTHRVLLQTRGLDSKTLLFGRRRLESVDCN